ncbi:MAG TPA: SigE family RNA polymerase sigma factor [Acidimicrobiales bacterium]
MDEVVVISQPAMLVGTGAAVLTVDFDAYVRDHAQALCRGAFLLTGDRHLAEDLVQTALAKCAPRWGRIADQGDPTPYVRTVIVRTAIAWRRRRWRGEVPTSPLPEATANDPVGVVDGRERLRHALLAVPRRQRAALVLRFYDDLSEAETARVMGCSVGTVKSQTARGLARLRTVLDQEGGA